MYACNDGNNTFGCLNYEQVYARQIQGVLMLLNNSNVAYKVRTGPRVQQNYSNQKKVPLVITSAVNVSAPFVKLTDPVERVSHALDAIRAWLSIDKTLAIVICDGSGYDFTLDVEKEFPSYEIECLSFYNNSDMVASRGKGYGEGEIMMYVLNYSQIIKGAEYFAKCTSKLWVENYLDCLSSFNGVFGCEKQYRKYSLTNVIGCDTRFYITSKLFFKSSISDCYEKVNDYDGYFLEHAFADALKNSGVSNVLFTHPPIVNGISGTSGRFNNNDDNNVKWLAKHLLRTARLKLDNFRAVQNYASGMSYK
jgi:hypothetical protein